VKSHKAPERRAVSQRVTPASGRRQRTVTAISAERERAEEAGVAVFLMG
jgi:hypothetical protein